MPAHTLTGVPVGAALVLSDGAKVRSGIGIGAPVAGTTLVVPSKVVGKVVGNAVAGDRFPEGIPVGSSVSAVVEGARDG